MKLNIQEMQKLGAHILEETVKVCERNNISYYAIYGTLLGTLRHQGCIPWDSDTDLTIPQNEIPRFVEVARKELPADLYVDYFVGDKKSANYFPRIGLKGYFTDNLHVDIFPLIGIPSDENEVLQIKEEIKRLIDDHKKQTDWIVLDIKYALSGNLRPLLDKIKYLKYRKNQFAEKYLELCNGYDFAKCDDLMIAWPDTDSVTSILKKDCFGQGERLAFNNFTVRCPNQSEKLLEIFYGDWRSFPPEEEIETAYSTEYIIRRKI